MSKQYFPDELCAFLPTELTLNWRQQTVKGVDSGTSCVRQVQLLIRYCFSSLKSSGSVCLGYKSSVGTWSSLFLLFCFLTVRKCNLSKSLGFSCTVLWLLASELLRLFCFTFRNQMIFVSLSRNCLQLCPILSCVIFDFYCMCWIGGICGLPQPRGRS